MDRPAVPAKKIPRLQVHTKNIAALRYQRVLFRQHVRKRKIPTTTTFLARPGQARPGQARPGQARPDEAKPGQGQARPGQGQARRGQARPGPGQARPGQA